MLTLHELVSGTDPLLLPAGAVASTRPYTTAAIRCVELCDEAGRLSTRSGTGDVLAILKGPANSLLPCTRLCGHWLPEA